MGDKRNREICDMILATMITPFPQIVLDGLSNTLQEIEINFNDVNDINLCSHIIHDAHMSVITTRYQENAKMKFNSIVHKYIDKIRIKRRFVENLHILYKRYIVGFHKNSHVFMQEADTFATAWIDYESQRKQICKALLDSQSLWKCYQCNMMNNNNVNRCMRCHKGINPLMMPKLNNSDTFCVSKPFGLIQLSRNVSNTYMCMSSSLHSTSFALCVCD